MYFKTNKVMSKDMPMPEQKILTIEIWDNSSPVGRGDLPVNQIAAIETDPKQHDRDLTKNAYIRTLDGRSILSNRPADSCVGAFNASGMVVIPAVSTQGDNLKHYWLNTQAVTIEGYETDDTPVLSVKGIDDNRFYVTTDDHGKTLTRTHIEDLNIPVSSVG